MLSHMSRRQPIVAVCGGGEASARIRDLAEAAGFELARRGALVISGGLGGVMEACCKGAKRAGGTTVGILPSTTTAAANDYVDVPIASGMSHGRNSIIVHTADAILALPGSYGTLSEIALALTMGKTVVALGETWAIPGLERADSLESAVERLLTAANEGRTMEPTI